MFLLNIIKNKRNLVKNIKLKHYIIKRLKIKIFLLKQLNFNNLKFILQNKNSHIQQDLITYIINISLTTTNTIVNITDIKGNLIFFNSAGSINLRGKQKVKQPIAIIKLLKILITKANFLKNQPVAIHFKNFNSYYLRFVIHMLKKKFFIKTIRTYNLLPHNGCRPKKIKRTKRKI